MPIVHACKACGSRISEAELQAGTAIRKGAFVYCTECSQLILEPAEVAPQAASITQPGRPSQGVSQRPERGPLKSSLSHSSEDPPTGKHDALSRDGIEVMEEFEILNPSAEMPDLERELQGEDRESAIDTGHSEPPLAEQPAAPSRRLRGRFKSRLKGGRGHARGAARPSALPAPRAGAAGGPASHRPRPSKSLERQRVQSAKPQPGDSERNMPKGSKEIFFQSGSRKASRTEPGQEGMLDSNILRSVQKLEEERRHPSRLARRSGRAKSAEENDSGRGSRRESLRGAAPSSHSHLYIAAGAGLLLILVLAFAFMGNSKSTRSTSKPDAAAVEDNQPAHYYSQKALEKLQKGDKLGAADLYLKAADAADRAGDSAAAQRFNQAAYGLKFKTAY